MRLNLFSEFKLILERYSELMTDFSKVAEQFRFIDPYELRKEMAQLFKSDNKFQLQKMDDPVEALFAILNAFHSFSVNATSLKYIYDKPCNPSCLSHNLFWINILEQFECKCGATSEVLKYDYNYFIYEAYVKEILTQSKNEKENSLYQNKFFEYLQNLNSNTKTQCPEKCKINKVKKNLFLLNSSPYLCFNLVWIETNPRLSDICKLFFMLPLKFKNSDLFEIADKKNASSYELFGLICYWGAHYICFFKSEDGDSSFWISYDDMIVNKINTWKDLIIKCLKSHFHPTILFYRKLESERGYSSVINTKDEIPDDDINKIIEYCIRFDKEKESPYKNEEQETNRLRPSPNVKKSSDELSVKILEKYKDDKKNTKPTINDNITEDNKINLEQDDILINPESEKKQKLELKNPEPNINYKNLYVGEDEWICEKTKCHNINKIDTYTCLKCKELNLNIYDLITQQKIARYDKKDEILQMNNKRHNSIPPKKLENNFDMDVEYNNNSNNNKEINKYRMDDYSVSNYCSHPNNLFKIKCDNCKFPLEMQQRNNSKIADDITKRGKYSEYDNSLKLIKDSNGINSYYDFNKKESYSDWLCQLCSVKNKFNQKFCSKCYRSDTNISNKMIDNLSNTYSFNKNTSMINTRQAFNTNNKLNNNFSNSSSSALKPALPNSYIDKQIKPTDNLLKRNTINNISYVNTSNPPNQLNYLSTSNNLNNSISSNKLNHLNYQTQNFSSHRTNNNLDNKSKNSNLTIGSINRSTSSYNKKRSYNY